MASYAPSAGQLSSWYSPSTELAWDDNHEPTAADHGDVLYTIGEYTRFMSAIIIKYIIIIASTQHKVHYHNCLSDLRTPSPNKKFHCVMVDISKYEWLSQIVLGHIISPSFY